MGLLTKLFTSVASKKAVEVTADWLVKMRWLKESEKPVFSADLSKFVQAMIELETGKPALAQVSVGTVRGVSKSPLFGGQPLRTKITLLGKKKSRV